MSKGGKKIQWYIVLVAFRDYKRTIVEYVRCDCGDHSTETEVGMRETSVETDALTK